MRTYGAALESMLMQKVLRAPKLPAKFITGKEEKKMQKKFTKKLWSSILSMMLIAAMALSVTACGGKETETAAETVVEESTEAAAEESTEAAEDAQAPAEEEADTEETAEAADEQTDAEESTEAAAEDVTVLGEGSTVFTLMVTDQDGNETAFEIHTDKTTVGEALLELDLIAGDESEYGLYVKTVNGITADYDVDGTYWAFYINGEYASTGVDATDIEEGGSYALKVEK